MDNVCATCFTINKSHNFEAAACACVRPLLVRFGSRSSSSPSSLSSLCWISGCSARGARWAAARVRGPSMCRVQKREMGSRSKTAEQKFSAPSGRRSFGASSLISGFGRTRHLKSRPHLSAAISDSRFGVSLAAMAQLLADLSASLTPRAVMLMAALILARLIGFILLTGTPNCTGTQAATTSTAAHSYLARRLPTQSLAIFPMPDFGTSCLPQNFSISFSAPCTDAAG